MLAKFSAALTVMKNVKPILYAGALVGVLDITAACINAWVIAGFTPARVLKGVASGLLGRSALEGGFATTTLGLVMHFMMALTVATIFYVLSRRFPFPQRLSVVVPVGLLYGAAVFAVNNFGTALFLSWVRSLYLHTPVLFKPPMGWSQLVIHLFCVGLPVALVMRHYSRKPSPQAALSPRAL
jgi:glucan phosphoethanolaminetransferase (alkaline phosphatase superfamily)